jgi:hypothetical protein
MVGSLIAAAIGLVQGTVVYAVATFAINFAVSFIVNRAFAPNVDDQQSTNNREQVPPTTDNAVPVVYGDAYLGGTFVDAVLSTNQKVMYYTLAISSISPNGQFTFDRTKFYYGGRLITFDTTDLTRVVSLTDDAGNVDTKIDAELYISLYTSDASGNITAVNTGYMPWQVYGATSPSPVYTANSVPAAQQWPSTGRRMNGLAFAVVALFYNANDGQTSLQPITFKVKHALNGTGVAKPGDVWYDYMTSTIYGAAVDAAYVDSAAATTLNTYSDQTITYTPSGGGSATQARYRINGVLTGNIPCLENIDKILTACDSWMTYNAASGKWSVVVNKAETAAFAFNDTNIVGEIRVSATDITSSVNQIEARFPFKENKDQPNFVFLQTPAGLLYPNEPVNKTSVTYDLVNDSVQAQYLANRVLEQAREDLIVSFNTTYFGIQVDAGDVVSVTNADYGWSSKLFRVMKVNEVSLPDGNLGARLEMSEYSAAVYDDASITAYAPVPNSNIAAPEYFSATGTPTVLASRPDATQPSFDVRVTIPATGRVTQVILYATTSATPAVGDWFELSRQTLVSGAPFTNSANYDFLNLVLPAGTYYFSYIVGNESAASARSTSSSSFVWSPLPTSSALKTATAIVYKWFNTAPTLPSGTSTYTWATDSFPPPSGWTLLPGTSPGSGYVLVSASIDISALESATTTTITWSEARLLLTETNAGSVYSPRVAFARVSGTITQTYGTITTTGTASFPSSAQSLSTWGFSATWTGTDPDPTSVNPLYRTDGTYNSTLDQIVWSTPYIATLRVGTLSAFSTDTGDLNVSGNITMDSYGAIKGGQTNYATGTGFFLGYSGSAYKFSIGDATNYLQWSGTSLNIAGSGTFKNLTSFSNNYVELGISTGGSALRVFRGDGSSSPVFYLQDISNGGAVSSGWFTKTGNPNGYFQVDNCRVATTANITLSGTQTIDGVAVVAGNRVLVKNQTTTSQNGIYVVATGAWTRATDSDTWAELYDGTNRQMTLIIAGTTSVDKYYYFSGATTGTIGTTAISYTALDGQNTTYSGECLWLNPTGFTGLYVSDSTTYTGTPITYIRGSRAEGQLIVEGKQKDTITTQHAARFRHLNASNTIVSSGIAATAGGDAFYAEVGTYGPFTGSHDGLLLKTAQVAAGDILVNNQLIAKKDVSNTLFSVVVSSQANAQACGIYAYTETLNPQEPPAALIDSLSVNVTTDENGRESVENVLVANPQTEALAQDYYLVSMNALGDGQVNVCGENGDIQPGDLIVTSSMPGKGMKQADDLIRSYTVAKAQEAATFASPTEVKMIACIYLCG